MATDFAYLEEIWGTPAINPPACGKKNIDNIMDAYIADDCKGKHDPFIKMETRQHAQLGEIDGYNANAPLYSQSFSLDEFYSDEIKNHDPIVLEKQKKMVQPVVQEESMSLTREEIYKDILEKYANTNTNSPQQQLINQKEYIELFIYIVSGIFLIFIMEQVLQLGSKLR